MRLLIATHNEGKAREFADLLGGGAVVFENLSNYPDIPEVEETGRTFLANACLKASAYAKATKSWALADDSGLEVDALQGKPGVTSARWATLNGVTVDSSRGRQAVDDANLDLILRQLDTVPDDCRAARFVCVLALADPSGDVVLTTRGTMEGRLLRERRGTGGFGYDPIFLIPELDQTSAELSSAEKNARSHRGSALRRLRALPAFTKIIG